MVVISSIETSETLERWTFNVSLSSPSENVPPNASSSAGSGNNDARGKTDKEVSGEISSIIRQITSSVTFLPLLPDNCAFDLLIYTPLNTVVPVEWEQSDARGIEGGRSVRLREFDTGCHRVGGGVCYRDEEEWDLP